MDQALCVVSAPRIECRSVESVWILCVFVLTLLEILPVILANAFTTAPQEETQATCRISRTEVETPVIALDAPSPDPGGREDWILSSQQWFNVQPSSHESGTFGWTTAPQTECFWLILSKSAVRKLFLKWGAIHNVRSLVTLPHHIDQIRTYNCSYTGILSVDRTGSDSWQ